MGVAVGVAAAATGDVTPGLMPAELVAGELVAVELVTGGLGTVGREAAGVPATLGDVAGGAAILSWAATLKTKREQEQRVKEMFHEIRS